MTHLAVFVEEASAKAMLDVFLPRILPEGVHPMVFAFEGKSDLEKQLVFRLRHWNLPNTRFLVMRDQDLADCREVKRFLLGKCREAGRPEAVVRIACRCLEAWYFGDLAAVESALGVPDLQRHQRKAKYREPDSIQSADRELENITKREYQKVAGSRKIGKHLHPEKNRSESFGHFVTAVKRLIAV